MTPFLQIATAIGQLVEQKNAAYGSSFADAGAFLQLLYPEGLQPAQYDDALLTVRIFDKLKRIATDRDALGESPYRDIAGYGILGAALVDQKRKGSSACRTSAETSAATKQRKARTASAPKPAASRLTPASSKRNAGESRPAKSAAPSAGSSTRSKRS